jgi:hypothetical protein
MMWLLLMVLAVVVMVEVVVTGGQLAAAAGAMCRGVGRRRRGARTQVAWTAAKGVSGLRLG